MATSAGVERAVRAGVARDEVADRVLDRLEERLGDADGQGGAERVAQAAGVLDGDPALLAGDAHAQGPAGALELDQPGRLAAALDDLGGGRGRRACAAGRRRPRGPWPAARG